MNLTDWSFAMFRRLIVMSALLAGSALAQQNTDISGASFQNGKADATLAALGRQAAASGNRLVITAPPEWHARIKAKIRVGGNATVVLRDGFYENVLVRIESGSAQSEESTAERVTKAELEKSRAEAQRARADAERSRAEAARAKAEAERLKADAEKARAEAEAARAQAIAQQQAAAARAQAVKKAAVPAAAAATPRAAAGDPVAAARSRLEQALKDGRGADGTLAVAALESGDTLYVDGPVVAATRREGRRLVLYWVDGDLDLRRSELKVLAPNRYQVMSQIRGEGTLRREFIQQSLDASEPAANARERLALEKNINEGNMITRTLRPDRLREGDVIYTNGQAAAVVRRNGGDLTRYWLVGSLDLTQTGLQADGPNRYKVLTDTVH